MKSIIKTKIIILMIFGIVFALSPLINNSLNFNMGNNDKSPENNDYTNLDNENLKFSKI